MAFFGPSSKPVYDLARGANINPVATKVLSLVRCLVGYADRPAGHHQLLATQTLFPGDSKRDIKTESGGTYFFPARTSDRAKAVTGMAFVGGLAGALVAVCGHLRQRKSRAGRHFSFG
jgi:hypothetical protein